MSLHRSTYQCGICLHWFQYDPDTIIRCAVVHGPGTCCHYGEVSVEAQMTVPDPIPLQAVPPLTNAPQQPRCGW